MTEASNRQDKEPKKHGSHNIWIDAAIEALTQAREEDGSISVMLVTHSGDMSGILFEGEVAGVAAALAHYARKDEHIAKTVDLVHTTFHIDKKDDFGKFLDRLTDELLRRNRPEE